MRDVTVTLIDDLDHTKADETVIFGLDGREYELDLSKAHASELRKMANRYIAVARRRARTAVLHRTPRRTQADRERARQMRAWAVSRGLMTSERGRIPEHVRNEWEAANRPTAAPARGSSAAKSARAADKATARKSPARRSRPRRPSGRSESSRTSAKGQRDRAKK